MQFLDQPWFSESSEKRPSNQKKVLLPAQVSQQRQGNLNLSVSPGKRLNEQQSIGKHKRQKILSVGLPQQISRGKYIRRLRTILPDTAAPESLLEQQSASQTKPKDPRDLAKMTRQRKKLYVKMIEQRQVTLQRELANKQSEIQEAQAYLQKAHNQNSTISNLATERHSLIKKLQQLAERMQKAKGQGQLHYGQEEEIDNSINQVLDALTLKVGASGKERLQTIDEYFKQIVNLSLPALHRYVLWTAEQGKHVFAPQNLTTETKETDQQNDIWYQQLKESVNLSQQQRKQMIEKRQLFIAQKQKLMALIETLRQVKENIYGKSIELEGMIEKVREILTPLQCAHFCLFIQKNKYRKQLHLCDNISKEQLKTVACGRKRVKSNEKIQ